MRNSALAPGAFLLVLASMATANTAFAFCRTTTCSDCPPDDTGCPSGNFVVWPARCVSFSLHYSASKQVDFATATAVVQKAFDVWQEAECPNGKGKPSIRLGQVFGSVACDLHEYNQGDSNANIVMFRDDKWPYEGSPNVLALTTVTYSRRSGEIYDVDMEINGTQRLAVSDPVPPGRYDLQSIVTHEAGHFLGLGHSFTPTATMVSQYTSGNESFRQLDPDDIAGICAVFPPDRAAPACDFSPRQGFSPQCGIYPSGDAGHCSVSGRRFLGPGSGARSSLAFSLLAGVLGLCRRRRRVRQLTR